MESAKTMTYPDLEVPMQSLSQKIGKLVAAVIVLAVLIWSYKGAEINFLTLYQNKANMLMYLKGFMKPDFLEWRDYAYEMLITIQIAIWGTLLAIIFAVPFGLLCSANIAPALQTSIRR